MPPRTRTEILKALPPLRDVQAQGRLILADELAPLRPHTVEPLYAIPAELLDFLSRRIKDWFSPEQLALEDKLTRLCTAYFATAIFHGQFVSHLFFSRREKFKLNEDVLGALGWDQFMTLADVQQTLNKAEKLEEPVWHRRQAYLGWLITSPTFLAERGALRTRWQDAVIKLGGIPSFPVRHTLQQRGLLPAGPGCDLDHLAQDFTAFYDRWDLLGLATWDLPQPKMGNFGCPALLGHLGGLQDSPSLQLPQTLHLPVRFPAEGLIHGPRGDHLAEWQAVEEQRHPDRLNYTRLQRILHLHFLRNVVLASGYEDRFRRRVSLLDQVFAEYFDDESEETVRKLRQWIDHRLQLTSRRRARKR